MRACTLPEIPDDLMLPVRPTLNPASFEEVIAEIKSDTAASKALRELMRGDG